MAVTYAVELERAIRAARCAGDLLRAEFHTQGKAGFHAGVDRDVEKEVNRLLAVNFPLYGYRGRELGLSQYPGDAHGHLWLVDPHDGTNAANDGFRGPAVSIALLRDGLPVLGVVHAYSAPDDNGDLFAWAEGSGALTRNGREVSRKWPNSALARCTVLVSHHADRNSAANANAVAPMRFRGVASIAYRFALVAAGEGDLAVSVNNPVAWHYAAGHALLRGAGANLYDSESQPIHYDREGSSSCGGRCFGGPLTLVEAVSGRDWAPVCRHLAKGPEPYSLCWPVQGQTIADGEMLARAQGCLLGQFSGDALGSLVEFQSPEEIARRFPKKVRELGDGGTWATIAGQLTDDSEMALMLARSILLHGTYSPEAAARAYAWWYSSRPFDIGNTTKTALSPTIDAIRAHRSAAETARNAASRTSQANGALMRICPLGILGATCGEEVVLDWARSDAALTHANPVCQDANAVFTAALSFAIRTGASFAEVYEHALMTADEIRSEPSVTEALRKAELYPPESYTMQQGWVLIAFQNAFYQLLHARSLEDGVVDTVMHGGDTDTNAAIAGALLGAVRGRDAVPTQWVDRVLTCRPISGLPGVQHPRPEAFWPVDAPLLAERLLLTGR